MNILPDLGTESSDTPARLETLLTKLSIVTIRTNQDSKSKFPCERLRSPMFRGEICSVVLRELLEVRAAPLHCTNPVQPGGCTSRSSSSR